MDTQLDKHRTYFSEYPGGKKKPTALLENFKHTYGSLVPSHFYVIFLTFSLSSTQVPEKVSFSILNLPQQVSLVFCT